MHRSPVSAGDDIVWHTAPTTGLACSRDDLVFCRQYIPWAIEQNRGTGIVVDTSSAVWVRRYDVSAITYTCSRIILRSCGRNIMWGKNATIITG